MLGKRGSKINEQGEDEDSTRELSHVLTREREEYFFLPCAMLMLEFGKCLVFGSDAVCSVGHPLVGVGSQVDCVHFDGSAWCGLVLPRMGFGVGVRCILHPLTAFPGGISVMSM